MFKGIQQVSQLLSGSSQRAPESAQFSAERLTATLDGMKSQLYGPSTSSYQGKRAAAFGQINPQQRSLLKSKLFSYEII